MICNCEILTFSANGHIIHIRIVVFSEVHDLCDVAGVLTGEDDVSGGEGLVHGGARLRVVVVQRLQQLL